MTRVGIQSSKKSQKINKNILKLYFYVLDVFDIYNEFGNWKTMFWDSETNTI